MKAAADRIPPHLLRRAKELFYEFDHDGNGVIDAAEVKAVMKCPCTPQLLHGALSPALRFFRLPCAWIRL